jgi:GntR family transcriptional regulator, galactonate operon transcriptional repressor
MDPRHVVALFSPQSLHEQVVRHIGLSIVRSAAAQPGQTLPSEPELCAQLKVSRPVLREAIKVLAAKGLVESRPKLGTQARPRHAWNLLDPDVLAWLCEAGPDAWLLRNLSEVRLIIEPQAARLAAARATADEIATLDAWYRRMCVATDNADTFTAADTRFHAAILTAAHNELLEQMSAAIGTALRASMTTTAHLTGAIEASLPLHGTVVDAIRARDEHVAESAMRELITMTMRDIDRALHSIGMRLGES